MKGITVVSEDVLLGYTCSKASIYSGLDNKEISDLCVATCKPHPAYIKLVFPSLRETISTFLYWMQTAFDTHMSLTSVTFIMKMCEDTRQERKAFYLTTLTEKCFI